MSNAEKKKFRKKFKNWEKEIYNVNSDILLKFREFEQYSESITNKIKFGNTSISEEFTKRFSSGRYDFPLTILYSQILIL